MKLDKSGVSMDRVGLILINKVVDLTRVMPVSSIDQNCSRLGSSLVVIVVVITFNCSIGEGQTVGTPVWTV